MDGVALCARFSLATNRLRYCGPDGADAALYRAITDGRGIPEARAALERFEALTPYLEAIGRRHGLDPFDARVVEAYWIGNELLDVFGPTEFRQLLEVLVRRGLPAPLARRLAEHLPERPIPHHAFHVAFVGVGNVTGHVETTLANIEACRPRWAVVTGLEETRLAVRSPTLVRDGLRLAPGPDAAVSAAFDRRMMPGLAIGDPIALHWGLPALRLAPSQSEALRRYTDAAIAAANESLPSLGVLAVATGPSGVAGSSGG